MADDDNPFAAFLGMVAAFVKAVLKRVFQVIITLLAVALFLASLVLPWHIIPSFKILSKMEGSDDFDESLSAFWFACFFAFGYSLVDVCLLPFMLPAFVMPTRFVFVIHAVFRLLCMSCNWGQNDDDDEEEFGMRFKIMQMSMVGIVDLIALPLAIIAIVWPLSLPSSPRKMIVAAKETLWILDHEEEIHQCTKRLPNVFDIESIFHEIFQFLRVNEVL